MKNVFCVACISGMIAVAIVLIIFWVIFPTAWVFFIIPAVVGWSIDRFGTFDATKLENEEEFTATARKVGLTCAAIVLACIIISVLPLFLVHPKNGVMAWCRHNKGSSEKWSDGMVSA